MSFSHIETKSGANGAGASTATLDTPANGGDLLVGTASLAAESTLADVVVTSGFLYAGAHEVGDRFIAVFYTEADAGEDEFAASYSSDATESVLATLSRYSMDGDVGAVAADDGTATNAVSVTVGPVTTEVGALLFALFKGAGESVDVGAYALRSPSGGFNNDGRNVYVADKIATSTSESATNTLEAQALRQSAVLVSFSEIAAGPQISLTSGNLQPGGAFTFEYSDFESIPTSPITLTDSNNNSITVAVTIDDTDTVGVHSGTASGTMPALPSSGSASSLLFGDVTAELTA